MRKKRGSRLSVSEIFVLKHSSCPPSNQKNSDSSFRQAVCGINVGSKAYNNIWPELKVDGKFSKYRDGNKLSGDNGDSGTSLSRWNVESNIESNVCSSSSAVKNNGEVGNSLVSKSNDNFPSLDVCKKYKGRKPLKAQQPQLSQIFQPGSSHETNILVKTHQFPKKGTKPKRHDPICIDIESAIELSKCRQKKELKRLHQKRPRQLNAVCNGNPLDSANPERRKGKVRPNKKKKLTSLRKMMERLKHRPAEERDLHGALCKQLDGKSLTKEHMEIITKAKLHTSKFREYCRNFASRELVESVKQLLVTVRGYQDRMHLKDEVKARARRRYAIGFHECWKLLKASSFKLIVVATNIERNEALLEKINEFVVESTRQGVPVIFAGTCTDLSFCLFKKNRICIVGIINYDGANETYNKVMTLFERDKAEYEFKINQIIEDEINLVEDVAEELRLKMLKQLQTD